MTETSRGRPSLSWRRPGAEEVRSFLARQRGRGFAYPDVGATRGTPPEGWVLDHNRVRLGEGAAAFAAARAALGQWEPFRLGWVEPGRPETPIATGEDVAVLARPWGFWFMNACRIVYTLDEAGPPARFGFAYGTLPDHAERGEERFLVEQLADGSVWYDILAFSRPGSWLVRVGYPLARRLQRRFAAGSLAAMARAVRAATEGRP